MEGGERERAPRVTLPVGVMRAVGCDCCGGPHPFGVRFSAVVPCVCACYLLCACVLGMFSGALGGHHLSMAACVNGHVRMRVRAYGMKEWLEERGIWFGGYLDRIHLAAVATCTTDVFPHNGGGCDRIFRSGPSMQFGFHSTGAQWSSCNGW
ncbi:complement regulatory protein [Trypanosoma cruzi]|nr:complement regulatory protein [Trypanosoma cruzi]